MARWRYQCTLALGLVSMTVAAACSGDEPDLGPNDPESLAAAATLNEDDLPEGGWETINQTFEALYPAPDPDATPFPLPPALDSCEFLQGNSRRQSTPPASMNAAHGRIFFVPDSRGTGDTVFTTTQVFETAAAAQATVDAATGLNPFAEFDASSEACRQGLAAVQAGVNDGSAILVRRERELGFEIRGVQIQQFKTTLNSSAGVETNVTTLAVFARGHVFARYHANETTDGILDHERLIRAYIQRVTDAQFADRALAQD